MMRNDEENVARLSPFEIRRACRSGTWVDPTCGVAMGFVQANLVVLRGDDAEDFEAFCRKNPKPCPLLAVLPRGQYEPATLAVGADLRSDLPRYRVFRDGEVVATPMSIEGYWSDECVAFLIGCSFTFEEALLGAGIPVRHLEQGCNVPMYRTNIDCEPSGRFAARLVVSMRPMQPAQARQAAVITAAYPRVHGGPIQIGNAAALGIGDLGKPDYGDPVTIREGEVPVFWACGVTPMEAVLRSKPSFAITHEPGHMLVTDLTNASLRENDASNQS